MERRYLTGCVELRNDDTGQPVIRGYAAVFNSLSEDLGGFREVIRPGAFRDAIAEGQDVRGLFNHDANHVLGRTTSGTLRLAEDGRGLRYEISPPDTSSARDLLELLKRGDVSQSSFAFTVRGSSESWRQEGDTIIRELHALDLYDVSPVTYPAYKATVAESAKRSLAAIRQAKPSVPDVNRIRLNQAKLEMRK